MKGIFLLIITICLASSSYAQKATITDTSYNAWIDVKDGMLSADGTYALYNIRKNIDKAFITVICSTDRSSEVKLPGILRPTFSDDGLHLYGILNKKLIRIQLNNKEIDTIANVQDYDLVTLNRKEYLIYKVPMDQSLVVRNTKNGNRHTLSGVVEFWYNSRNGNIIVRRNNGRDTLDNLLAYNPENKNTKFIFSGKRVRNLIFDNSGKSIAFISGDGVETGIWYFADNYNRAEKLLGQHDLPKMLISTEPYWQFSPISDVLYFVGRDKQVASNSIDSNIEIWNYQDRAMYSYVKNHEYKLPVPPTQCNLLAIRISDRQITRLVNSSFEKVATDLNDKLNEYIVVEQINHSQQQVSPLSPLLRSYYLVEPKGNQKVLLKSNSSNEFSEFKFSPDRKHLIYFDGDSNSWMCYDITTRKSNEFGGTIKNELLPYHGIFRKNRNGTYGLAAWIKQTDKVILQGERDLWEVSIKNKTAPVKLTTTDKSTANVFSFCGDLKNSIIDQNHDLYVHGIDQETMERTIYRLNIAKQKFTFLTSGNFFWLAPLHRSVSTQYFQISKNGKAFLFLDGNVSKKANYYYTKDFKTITAISSVYPERSYNWMSSELLSYKDSLGNSCKGILYKPEDFDPNKKYPVIFSIYLDQSHELNRYISPDPVGSNVNIPLMVSNGYLVFKPDIYMKRGQSGKFIVLSVIAAADHLSKFIWVDAKRIGITRHSLGGGEVNYLITKTTRFAAASAGAGVSSMINNYNDLWDTGKGSDKQGFVINAYGMSGPLENAIGEYVDFSPILNANRIQTPLLLMHNNKDIAVDFYHSTQFFIQLRSMRKPVWLLSYQGDGHFLGIEKNKLDYQKKVRAFFDHFLKNQPVPDWMNDPIK